MKEMRDAGVIDKGPARFLKCKGISAQSELLVDFTLKT
jgi:hypothetical protein